MSAKVAILITILVFALVLVLILKMFTSSTTQKSIPIIPVASPIGNPSTFPQATLPSSSGAVATDSAYVPGSLEKDFQRIEAHIPLSQQDQAMKAKLINSLNGSSGILVGNSDFEAEYDKVPNEFMVELKINDADQAKKDAESWFSQQGLSVSGICNLPVVFYLNSQVSHYYKTNNLFFNPVPDGC